MYKNYDAANAVNEMLQIYDGLILIYIEIWIIFDRAELFCL